MNNLTGVAKFHNLVVVPNKGLFSFGGVYGTLINAQRLPAIDGSWELGPYLYKQQIDYDECVLQVIKLSKDHLDCALILTLLPVNR